MLAYAVVGVVAVELILCLWNRPRSFLSFIFGFSSLPALITAPREPFDTRQRCWLGHGENEILETSWHSANCTGAPRVGGNVGGISRNPCGCRFISAHWGACRHGFYGRLTSVSHPVSTPPITQMCWRKLGKTPIGYPQGLKHKIVR